MKQIARLVPIGALLMTLVDQSANSQQLPRELIQEILRGPAEIVLPKRSLQVPIVTGAYNVSSGKDSPDISTPSRDSKRHNKPGASSTVNLRKL